MTIRNAASMGTYGADWTCRGYAGQGNVQPLLESIAGRSAIVCGNGAGVFEQFEEARTAYPDAVVFAANDVGIYLPVLDHWVSLHTDNLAAWKAARWLNCKSIEVTKYHGVDPKPFIDYAWTGLTPMFCLSGYFAMQLAWIMGASRIMLCGCPGSPVKRFFEGAARQDFGYGGSANHSDISVRAQIESEMARLPEFKAAVRSLDGWTRQYFGGLEHG